MPRWRSSPWRDRQLASTGEAASRTSIVSPLDGWVSERRMDEGEAVKSDDHVLTVVDPRMLELGRPHRRARRGAGAAGAERDVRD